MSVVNDTAWKRAKQIFHEALEKTGPERAGFVASACGDDRDLRAQVQGLLAANDEAGEFMASPTMTEANEATRAATTLRTSPPAERPGATIGHYKLLQVIGEGGFGVVYMAEQKEPVRRRVALKIIKLGMDTKQVIARFEAERQALALMEHPNIARVFDAGATETGRPYFVMELVKGVPITEYCDSNRLTTRERLDLFTEICRAVQHAHQKGIVHRDLKPSNVLVTLHDGRPVPKVIDFGIAKATHQRLTEKTLFTEYGQFIGTPVYMSPEQAEMSGLDIDTRSDIYSLGVLLYELLTGTTPFDLETLRGAGFAEMQRMIREEEPPKPSTRLSTLGGALTDIAKDRRADPGGLTRLVRGDLDWIVMKALEKDRTRRYASASEFAADVGRHLGDEPVTARSPTAAYMFRKYVKKHKGPVSAVAAVVITALALGSVALWQARIAQRRGVRMQRQAMQVRANSILASASASVDPLTRALLVLELEDLQGLPGRLNIERDAASNPLPAAVFRGDIEGAAFSPDGTPLAATVSEGGTVRISPVDGTGKAVVLGEPDETISRVVFSPDGARLATVSEDGTVRIWEANGTGEPIVLRGHERGAWTASFSPDGTRLAGLSFTDNTVWVWRADGTGEPVVLRGHEQQVSGATFSPDGTRIVTASHDRTARVWRTDGTSEPIVLRGHERGVWKASFNPDGTRVVTASLDGTARVWRADGTGDAILMGHESFDSFLSRRHVRGAAFSPDGTQVVTTYSDGTVRVWAVDGKSDPLVLQGHSDEVWRATFSHDGARVVTISKDGTARVWRADGDRREVSVLQHEGELTSAKFSPDDTLVLTTSRDGTARVWRVGDTGEAVVLRGPAFPLFGVAFSPDGTKVAMAFSSQAASSYGARVWRADGRGEPIVLLGHEARVSSVAFSPDGTRVVTGSWDETARVWSADGTGDPLVLRGHEDRVCSVAFRSDGTRVLTGSEDGTARVWSADGMGEPVVLQHTDPVWAVAFGPDGTRVATGTRDGTARVWRVHDTGEPIVLRGHKNAVMGVAFSPDGTRLVTASGDGTARVWLPDGRGEPVVLRHTNEVSSVAFSPDGTRVVTGSWDNTARVWPADGKGDPLVLRGHIGWVNGVSFSPDGSRVATASADATARVWRVTLSALSQYLRENVHACLTPEQRMKFLAEPSTEAGATYAACERGYGREPVLLEDL